MTQQRPNRAQRRHVQPAEPVRPAQVDIDYNRGALCRVIHVDGAFGGPTPYGGIQMSIYADVAHAVEHSVLRLNRDTHTAEEQLQQKREWRREVEAELILNLQTARSLKDWLDKQIRQVEAGSSETFVSVTAAQEEATQAVAAEEEAQQ